MGSQYNGIPGNISYPGTTAIASSTNATPIVVTTSSVHNLSTGDYVDIEGHQTNTNANGVWPVTVLSTTTFSLTGSVGTAVGSGGTVQPLNMGNTATLPADGDPYAAATYTPGYGAALDRVTRLNVATGSYKIANFQTVGLTSDAVGFAPFTAVGVSAGAWTGFGEVGGPFSGYPLSVTGMTGDILEISCFGTANPTFSAGMTQLRVGIGYTTQVPGGSVSAVSKLVGVPLQCTNTSSPNQPFSMSACLFLGGPLIISAQFAFLYSGSAFGSLAILGDCGMTIKVWRPTGVPQ
jgi:hypothetical protein